MSKVYIVSSKRSPVGSFLGSLAGVSPDELGGAVIKNIVEEAKIDPANIDEVIVGNVLQGGHGQGIGRQVSMAGGIPMEVPGYAINILCGSGMKSIMNAYSAIKSGESNLIIAGGVESMSQAGFVISGKTRLGNKMGDMRAVDSLLIDGLTDAFHNIHMGVTAENIVKEYGFTREQLDTFAIKSQEKAIAAVDSGRFKDEIVPVIIKGRKGDVVVDTDEYPNRGTSLEKLAGLKPAFIKDGVVTAGNASGINDGASFVLMASEEAVAKYNLKPLVEVVAVGQGGVDPNVMGLGPVPAVKNALKKAELNLSDISLIEFNEAFAAQALGVMTQLSKDCGVNMDWFADKTNVNGGAIAIGHPLGASGNRITTTLIHEMKKRGSEYGLASLCIGGGMGTAIIVKNIK